MSWMLESGSEASSRSTEDPVISVQGFTSVPREPNTP